MTTVKSFLAERRTSGDVYNYQSMGDIKAKYMIDDTDYDEFIQLYQDAIDRGEAISLLTRPRRGGAATVRFDIDIKLPEDYPVVDIYTQDDIDSFTEMVNGILLSSVKGIKERNIQAFILEKTKVKIENGTKKRGFHIEYPFCVIPMEQQQTILFPKIQEQCKYLFQRYDGIAIGNIFDFTASLKNAWLLYGSKKTETSEAYQLTRTIPHQEYDKKTLPHLLSIHDKHHRGDIFDCIQDHKILIQSLPNIPEAQKKEYTNEIEPAHYLESIRKLLPMLNEKRSTEYDSWRTVGAVLYNTTGGSIEGFKLFDWFSQKGSNYNASSVLAKWKPSTSKATIGTIRYYAKEDSPEAYSRFVQATSKNYIMTQYAQCGQLTAVDCAFAIQKLHAEFLFDPVCDAFFQYGQHRWTNIGKEGHELKTMIKELESFFDMEIDKIRKQIAQLEDTEDGEEKDKHKLKELDKTKTRLIKERLKFRDTPFRDKIIKECKTIYLNREFNDVKDSHCHLMGFTNGVMDLKERVFRDGRYDDYITMTTGYPFDKSATFDNVNEFLSKIFPDPVLRDYHLKYKAHALYGGNPNKTILFQTNASGNNGKSKVSELEEKTFGEYAYKMPSSFLSYVDKGGSGAKADIAGIRGKRILLIQEPDRKSGVNVAFLKEFRGNDGLQARGLFEKKVSQFQNQSKLIISCNKLPDIETDDVAFFNSIRVLDYESTFNEEAPEDEQEQWAKKHFKVNKQLEFDQSFIQGYMRLLFETFLLNGIDLDTPTQVQQATEKYQMRSDPVLSFIRESTKSDKGGSLTYTELFNRFNQVYYTEVYKKKNTMKKDEFIAQLRKFSQYEQVVNAVRNICFLETDEVVDEVKEVKDEFILEGWSRSESFKRIKDIISHYKLETNKATSRQIKEYFMKQGIKIIEDNSNGHKVYISF